MKRRASESETHRKNKPFDSLSVEKSFNWNYSFITEKREALQNSVQDAKRSYIIPEYK